MKQNIFPIDNFLLFNGIEKSISFYYWCDNTLDLYSRIYLKLYLSHNDVSSLLSQYHLNLDRPFVCDISCSVLNQNDSNYVVANKGTFCVETIGNNTNYYVRFELTHLHDIIDKTSPIYIKLLNQTGNDINVLDIAYDGQLSGVFMNTIKPSDLKFTNSVTLDYDGFDASVNIASGLLTVEKSLFDGILPLDLKLVYDSYSLTKFKFLPKRWKLSCLYSLEFDNDNGDIVLIGSLFERIRFVYADNTTDSIWRDVKGQGLIIEYINSTYILRNIYQDNDCLIFDIDGFIIEMYTKQFTIEYTYGSSIVITITKGNQANEIVVTESIDYQGCLIIKLNNSISLSYFLTIDNDDKLIGFNICDTQPLVLLPDIILSYSSTTYNLLSIVRATFSIQQNTIESGLFFSQDSYNRITSLIKKNNNYVTGKYALFYDYLSTTIGDIKQKSTYYQFDENYDLIDSSEISNASLKPIVARLKSSFWHYYSKLKNKVSCYSTNIFLGNCDAYSSFCNTSVTIDSSTTIYYPNRKYLLLMEISSEQSRSFFLNEGQHVVVEIREDNGPQGYTIYGRYFLDGDYSTTRLIGIPFEVLNNVLGQNLYVYIYMSNIYGRYKFSNIAIYNLETTNRFYYKINGQNILINRINAIKYRDLNTSLDKEIVFGDSGPIATIDDLDKSLLLKKELKSFVIYNDGSNLLANAELLDIKINGSYLQSLDFSLIKETIKGAMSNQNRQYFDNNNIVFEKTISNGSNALYKLEHYDNSFNLISSIDFDNTKHEYDYDSNGNVTEEREGNSLNIITTNTYTDRKLVSSTSKVGNTNVTTSYSYLSNLELLYQTKINTNKYIETYSYDNAYKNLASTVFSGTNITSSTNSNTYDALDNLTSTRNTTGSYYYFEYDSYNLINKVKIGSLTLLTFTNYVYNLSSNTGVVYDYKTTTYSNGYKVKHSYNKYDNLYKVSDIVNNTETTKVTYLYFNNKPSDISSKTSQEASDLSSLSRLYKIIDNYANHVSYFDYDDEGKLTSKEIKEGSTTYLNKTIAYNSVETNNIDSISYSNLSLVENCTVTPLIGRVEEIESTFNNSNSISSAITYNSDNFISGITNTDENNQKIKTEYEYFSNSKYISSFTYNKKNAGVFSYEELSYDVLGNITSITDKNRKITLPYITTNFTNNYFYDSFSRLVRENNGELNKSIQYNYDSRGNITSIVEGDLVSGTGTITNATTISYSYNTTFKDKLVTFNGQTVSYDSFNNITSIGSASYSYIRGRLLERYQPSIGANETLNYYNKDSIRTKKFVGTEFENPVTGVILYIGDTVKYTYDDNKLLKEVRTSTISTNTTYELTFLYGINGVSGFVYNNNTYLYQKNILNDVTAIYKGSTLICKYHYDAYGNFTIEIPAAIINTSDEIIASINPFRYRSYYYDTDLGLYYLETRFYNPVLRRFMVMDTFDYLDSSKHNGLNLYAYSKNNPIMYVDPSGHEAISVVLIIIGFFIGAAIGGTCSIVGQGLSKGWHNINWSSVVFDSIIGGIEGAIAFSNLGIIGAKIASGITSFVGGIVGSLISNNGSLTMSDVTWTIISTCLSIALAKPGIQNTEFLFSKLKAKVARKTISNIIKRNKLNLLKDAFYSPYKNLLINKGYDFVLDFTADKVYEFAYGFIGQLFYND